MGAVICQDDGKGGRLVTVHGKFHSEPKRSRADEPVIVCSECDEIQTLSGLET